MRTDKLIDFGAATDLRIGNNYAPNRWLLDPDNCPPQLYVLPEETPSHLPEPIATFLSPVLWQNFDNVPVPADHISRSYNDANYVDSQTVLRCHASAHQAELLRRGHAHFLVTGDVYHRDFIDSTHYPVFIRECFC